MKKTALTMLVFLNVYSYCFGQNEISLRKELDILSSIVGKT